jgi:hypothetical protein
MRAASLLLIACLANAKEPQVKLDLVQAQPST